MDTEIAKQNEAMKDLEVVTLQKRVSELESQLEEAKKLIQKHLLEASEVDLLKMRSADTLTKAKSVIFENTKMIKNQELQIEALNKQVESLRDVVKITKDLLEIRNLEVDQLESKIHCMEEKHKAEKERQDLMHKRLEQMIRHNGDLKREYETQLCLFKALRERYDERELAKGVVNSLRSDIKQEKDKENENKSSVQKNEKNKDDKSEKEYESKEKQESFENSLEENEKMPSVKVETVQTKDIVQTENKIEGSPIQETVSNDSNVVDKKKIEETKSMEYTLESLLENPPKMNEKSTEMAQGKPENVDPTKIQSNSETDSVQN